MGWLGTRTPMRRLMQLSRWKWGPGLLTAASDVHRLFLLVFHAPTGAWNAFFDPVLLELQAHLWRLTLGVWYGESKNRHTCSLPCALLSLYILLPPSAHIKSCCTSLCTFLFSAYTQLPEPDLCLLKYLAQCLTFSELSINVRWMNKLTK